MHTTISYTVHELTVQDLYVANTFYLAVEPSKFIVANLHLCNTLACSNTRLCSTLQPWIALLDSVHQNTVILIILITTHVTLNLMSSTCISVNAVLANLPHPDHFPAIYLIPAECTPILSGSNWKGFCRWFISTVADPELCRKILCTSIATFHQPSPVYKVRHNWLNPYIG